MHTYLPVNFLRNASIMALKLLIRTGSFPFAAFLGATFVLGRGAGVGFGTGLWLYSPNVAIVIQSVRMFLVHELV